MLELNKTEMVRDLTRLWLAVIVALSLGIGCGDTIENNTYRCDNPSDCLWGWECVEHLCVNPAAQSDSGVSEADGSPDPKPDAGPNVADTGPNVADTGPNVADTGPNVADTGPGTCTANVSECVGLGDFRRCNSSGTGYLPTEACPDYQRCEAGACIAADSVIGSIYVMVRWHYDTLSTKFKYSGGISAGFYYNAEISSALPKPQVGTCGFVPYDSSVTKKVAFDAGPITITGVPGGTRTLTFDSTTKGYKLDLPISSPDQLLGLPLGYSGKGKGLVHSAFSGQFVVPPKRLITSPKNNAAVSKTSPLSVTWSGSTGSGTVELHLLDTPNPTATQYVRCLVYDTGSFTVPASFLSSFSTGGPAAKLMLLGEESGTLSAKGLNKGLINSVLFADSWVIFQ